ncbi:hypothetical protein LTR08_003871 [Meristemomyces frigidus]|nr:hypothetical protein LTR08_003871 [Meristemomyces frigidus]
MQDHRDDTYAAVQPAIPDPPKALPLNVTGLPKRLLSSEVISITQSPTESLLSSLATGKLTSTAVTTAFLQRAGLAGKLTNCLTELLPSRALARAKYLDDYLTQHKKPLGALHGLPISVKEHVGMKDLDLNAGFVSWVGRVAPDDALILKLLWKAGAVFYARTTEPQALMHLETSNNIYGVTVNPFNTALTPGGSSGGEGALLGLRGSCLGIGTDIWGSIRSPAANNGVFGFRPTSFRLPMAGLAATMYGSEHIVAVIGPLSTSLEGIKVFMKSIVDQQPWLYEPSLVPLAWRDSSSQGTLLRKGADGKRKLRIGVLADDGVVRPHPPILRGIATLVEKLRGNPDIEIVEFPPYNHAEAWRIISSLYFPDGGAEEAGAIDASGEPFLPLTNFIIKDNPNMKEMSVPEVWRLTEVRDKYKSDFTRHWNSINTTLAGPEVAGGSLLAVEAAEQREGMVDVILTPTGEADKVEEGYKPRNEQDRYNYELYKLDTYTDAPISLQLVGRRYEDEKVIEALEFMLDVAGMGLSPVEAKL